MIEKNNQIKPWIRIRIPSLVPMSSLAFMSSKETLRLQSALLNLFVKVVDFFKNKVFMIKFFGLFFYTADLDFVSHFSRYSIWRF